MIKDLKPDTNYIITVHVGIKGTYGQGVSSTFATDAAGLEFSNDHNM